MSNFIYVIDNLQIVIIQKKIDLGAFFFAEIGIDEELFLWAPETGNGTETLNKNGGKRALRTDDSTSPDDSNTKESKDYEFPTNPENQTNSENSKDNETTTHRPEITTDHEIEVDSGSSVSPENSARFDEVPETTTTTTSTTIPSNTLSSFLDS